jgi:Flp pilus assembly protein TadD
LTEARSKAPQHLDAWLLSATLARRQGDLVQAKDFIATAATLAPQDQDVALEAGVVAILSGDEEGARRNWLLVQSLAPNTPQAGTATQYLSQLPKDAG